MLDRAKALGKTTLEIFRAAAREYGEDRVSRMSAAVAYRAIFALAPLVLLAVFVFGIFIGSNEMARSEILEAVERFGGDQVAGAVRTVLESVETTGNTAGITGFALLLWTASSLFMEVQNDLNDIFDVPYEHTTGIVPFIRKRGIGFLFALGLGLVLLAVWVLNFAWNFLGDLFPESFEPVHQLIGVLTPLVSLVVLPLVIALSFQVMSRVKVRWRAVWWGSSFTAVAFLVAAYGTGLYFSLGESTAASVAASIFIIVLLAFVLSTVFLFGAEVTKVYNDYLNGGRVFKGDEPEEPEEPLAIIGEPEPAMPLAAVFAFLGGLFVGWRRGSKRQ